MPKRATPADLATIDAQPQKPANAAQTKELPSRRGRQFFVKLFVNR